MPVYKIDWSTFQKTSHGVSVDLEGRPTGGHEHAEWTGRFHTAMTGGLQRLPSQAERGWETPRLANGVFTIAGAGLSDEEEIRALLDPAVRLANES